MIDLGHDTFAKGVPHGMFEAMRRDAPVHWSDGDAEARGFWSLTRHADIVAANKDPGTFSSARGIRIEDQSREEYLARRTFQETDPPEHTVTRRLVNPAFAKPVMARFAPTVRDLAAGIVTAALESPETDAVEAIAKPLPMMMLGRILGVPDDDLAWLVEKGDALIGNTDPDFTETLFDPNDPAHAMMPFRSPAGADLYDYAQGVLDGAREVSADGILSRMMAAGLSGRDFKNFLCLLVAAGNDTTRYSIAMALHRIAEAPVLLEQVRDEAIRETAPDEFIRLASPTMHFRRTATRDVEMHGARIREGDKVLLWFVSGSRDEAVFERPHEAVLDRHPNRHLAFGQNGPHVCLGMWLAKIEVRAVLAELASQVARIEPMGAPSWTRSNFICGVKRLPVRITAI